MKNVNWTRILTILLVILAAYAILYVTGSVLARFRHVIVIFVLGALTAYVLTPLVNRLEVAFRVRWIAILLSYVMLASLLVTLAIFLVTPFIQQSQALVDNLQFPSAGSLQTIVRVQCAARQIEHDVNHGNGFTCGGLTFGKSSVTSTSADIVKMQNAIADLRTGTLSGPLKGSRAITKGQRLPPNPQPQTRVPPSYVKRIESEANKLQASYRDAVDVARITVTPLQLKSTIRNAKKTLSVAGQLYGTMSATPILLLRAQAWLDQQGISIDVHSKFGQLGRQLSNQGTYLLNNAVTILSETANTLLNLALILIIAFYLLSDGSRIIQRSITLAPARYRDSMRFFLHSLDRVLGGYIRGQLFLSALAGILGGAGAAALGVPFPLLIGILTFLLESIPIIGPLVALVPAVAVSLFFMSFVTTLLLFIWNMVFQQLVTNVLGPRVMGIAVGIHPLEAMLAVLIGYPLAGFLGALLAVPVAGILHIVIREMYAYLALGQALPTVATASSSPGEAANAEGLPVSVGPGRKPAAS